MGRHKKDCKCYSCKEKKSNTILQKTKKTYKTKKNPLEFEETKEIVPEIVPEVLPEIVPEVTEIDLEKVVSEYQERPEIVPEETKEIVPEETKEIVPEVVPEIVPEVQKDMPIVIKGYFILLIIDIVAPYLLLKLFSMFSKKFSGISVEEIRLSEIEKEDLLPIADEVAKGFVRKMSPEFALLISILAIYSTKIISLKND